jgi:hypothetical protein
MVYVVLLLSWDDMHLRKIFSDESIFVSSSISSANAIASLLTVCGVVLKTNPIHLPTRTLSIYIGFLCQCNKN